MASITIRNLDDEVETRLRVRAAGNGRSRPRSSQAIAQSRGLAVATRNTGDFTGMELDLIDPWRDG